MIEKLEKVIAEIRAIRSEAFGKNEEVYSALGKAMGRLIDAQKALKEMRP